MRRHVWLLICVAVALVLVLIGGLPQAGQAAYQSQPGSEAILASPTPTPVPIFGVTARGEWGDEAIRELARDAGVRWVRTSVSWASLQPQRGDVPNLSSLDAFFLEFQRLGIIPIVYITDNPLWAANSTCGPIDLVPISEFGSFMSALATRYNGTTIVDGVTLPRVDYWALYNEPDNKWVEYKDFGGCWGNVYGGVKGGVLYAQLLKVAWDAVHQANPNGQLGFGGLAAEPNPTCGVASCFGQQLFNFNMAGGDFVDDVLNYVKLNQTPPHTYFDFLDIHGYPAFANNWDTVFPYSKGFLEKANYYRKRMTDKGLTRYLISSEIGRPSLAAKKDAAQVPGSEDEQARFIMRLYAQAMAAGLRAVTWFTYADIMEYACVQGVCQNWNLGWGLLNLDYQQKMSYTAFKTLTQQMSTATYVSKVTLTPAVAAEIYLYTVPGIGYRSVVWATNTTSSVNVPFRGSVVKITDKLGVSQTITDGQAGKIWALRAMVCHLNITGSPLYVDGRPDFRQHLRRLCRTLQQALPPGLNAHRHANCHVHSDAD